MSGARSSPLAASPQAPRFFLVTIDAEGDNLWARPQTITTRNARYLPRFQSLCERFGLLPTYLVNHEMAKDPAFVEFGRDLLRRGAGEIGMHLHAWNSPPLYALTADDARLQPYLIEYPEPVLRDKVAAMTDLLEDTFGVPMRSHRAGRWGLNEVYARALIHRGYQVDCSVTPHVTWQGSEGALRGGVDYTGFPEGAYFVDPDDIRRPGPSPLLEVPMSVRCRAPFLRRVARRLVGRVDPPRWLRPKGDNLGPMLGLLDEACDRGRSYVEFMLHSSELMPGGSPRFPDAASIEAMYQDLDTLFCAAHGRFLGATLAQYHDHVCASWAPRA